MARRRLVWRTPQWAYERFQGLLLDLDGIAEDSEIAAAIRDEIMSLPGYPHYATEDDIIETEVSTVR